MNQLKVIYVTSSSNLYGDNKALLNILDGLVVKGIQPLVIVSSEGKMCDELRTRGIKYQIIKSYFSIYPPIGSLRHLILFFPRLFRTLWCNYKAVSQLKVLVEGFKPDLIHTNVGPVTIGFQVAKKLNIKHVWHLREYQNLDFDMHPFLSVSTFIKKLKHPINHCITITKGVFNHFLLSSTQANVIYDGVLPKNKIQFVPNKEKYFLFVGRLEEAKGIKVLIEAFIKLCQRFQDYKLLIAGDGDAQFVTELHQIIENSNCKANFDFLGFRDDIDELMAKATALVVPSRYEGFGFITVEAMFNGCLVIGNNTAGTKEILETESLGILYNNTEELVSFLHEVVSKGIQNYDSQILKAQLKAQDLYSREQNIESIYKCYKEILEN